MLAQWEVTTCNLQAIDSFARVVKKNMIDY